MLSREAEAGASGCKTGWCSSVYDASPTSSMTLEIHWSHMRRPCLMYISTMLVELYGVMPPDTSGAYRALIELVVPRRAVLFG